MSETNCKKAEEAVDLTKHYKPIGSRAIRAALEINNRRPSGQTLSKTSDSEQLEIRLHARE